jgi:hypothetical protein
MKKVIITILAAGAAWAQDASVETELRPQVTGRAGRQEVRRVSDVSLRDRLVRTPGVVRLQPLTEAEKATRRGGWKTVGRARAIERQAQQQGVWETLPSGQSVWRLAVQSAEAKAVRVHFQDFHVGEGQVLVYAANAKANAVLAGPYTGDGPNGDGNFWSGVVFADTVIVEYQASQPEQTPFQVAGIAHIHDLSSMRLTAVSEEVNEGPAKALGFPDADFCHVDANCAPEFWRLAARAVAIYFFIADDGNVGTCSGTLMNNQQRSFRPYFLTANHCVNTPNEARNLIVLWNYQTDFCNGFEPELDTLPQTIGSRLLTTGAANMGDFSLLLLSGDAPQGAIYAGWTSTKPEVGGVITGIHHPSGSFKRISQGNRVTDRAHRIIDFGTLPADMSLTVQWRVGVTQGGSSGSGLFNENRQLIGTLTGGASSCDNPAGLDAYGSFAAYFTFLRRYLVDDRP